MTQTAMPPAPRRAGRTTAALAAALPLLLSGAAVAAPNAHVPPKAPEGERACLVCHTAPAFDGEALHKSVHKDLACTDCHAGYDFKTHEASNELSAEDQALVEKLKGTTTAPRALLQCGMCHSDVVENLTHSVHTRWLAESRPVKGPTCLSCHDEIHHLRKIAEVPAAKKAMSERCQSCHEDPNFVKAAGLPQDPVTYRDSVHGRLVALGSDRAPGCFDCHSNHGVVDPQEAGAPVSASNKVKTCSKCHPGATENFAAAFTHKQLHEQLGPYAVHVAFSWLTTLTLVGLFVHVLLDLLAELRLIVLRRRREAEGHHEEEVPAALPHSVVRFDFHQRMQHWLLLVSVVALTVSGWPIRAASVNASGTLLNLMGGLPGAALIHRVCAVVMGVAAVYHLVYLTLRIVQKKLVLRMLPAPKDLFDVMGNLAFLVGLRKERPKFDKFSYIEKFDYWAVFWGVAIMGGTGLVRWFPVFFGKFLPGWVLYATQLAHGEEATLAASALFVWHFYNVHLKPSIFPMNWVWLTGHISVEQLREEHGLEYDRLVAGSKGADGEKK